METAAALLADTNMVFDPQVTSVTIHFETYPKEPTRPSLNSRQFSVRLPLRTDNLGKSYFTAPGAGDPARLVAAEEPFVGSERRRVVNRQLKLLIGGLVCALLPYVLFIGASQEVVINGVKTVDNRLNIAGVVGGLAAIAIGWRMAMQWETESDKAPKWRIAAAAIALAGAAQVVYSLDLFQ
ncbi:hypothetical protein [Actinokineospora alba]|uniref:hypothetical protein n=1 Tax=Actinokineospora alba TaxID=504798 RepID=UPI0015A1CA11|nr:hypothetical protein [Actinokineospora alba]